MMSVRRQLGIAKTHRHLIFRGAREQRHGRCVRHLALKPGIDLGLIFHIPARKKCGECQLRINDQVCSGSPGLVHQSEHALDDDLPAIGTLDRPHLSGCDVDDSHGELSDSFDLKVIRLRR
jgi:hypothetical protein